MAKGSFISLVSRDLLEEIDRKHKILVEVPGYHLNVRKCGEGSLKYLWDLSQWLRDPKLKTEIVEELGSNKRGDIQMVSKACKEGVRAAWEYLRGAVDYSNEPTDRVLSRSLLLHLAERVGFAGMDDVNRYRLPSEKAECFAPDFQTPHGSQVEPFVDKVCGQLKRSNAHPVNKAVFAHVSIVAIQPFLTANKRLGRLLQISTLYDHRFPTGPVLPGEKRIYYDLLKPAVIGFVDGDSEKQVPFFNWIASKINVKLDKCLEDVAGNSKGGNGKNGKRRR